MLNLSPQLRKIVGALGMGALVAGTTAFVGGRYLRAIPTALLATAAGGAISYVAWPKQAQQPASQQAQNLEVEEPANG